MCGRPGSSNAPVHAPVTIVSTGSVRGVGAGPPGPVSDSPCIRARATRSSAARCSAVGSGFCFLLSTASSSRLSRHATQPGCPCASTQRVHMQVGHCPRNQRQQRHTPGGGPPDPPIRLAAGHRCSSRISSPVSRVMYLSGESPLGHGPLVHICPTSGLRDHWSRGLGCVSATRRPTTAASPPEWMAGPDLRDRHLVRHAYAVLE